MNFKRYLLDYFLCFLCGMVFLVIASDAIVMVELAGGKLKKKNGFAYAQYLLRL